MEQSRKADSQERRRVQSLIPGARISFSENQMEIPDFGQDTLTELKPDNLENLTSAYLKAGDKAFDQEWERLHAPSSKS